MYKIEHYISSVTKKDFILVSQYNAIKETHTYGFSTTSGRTAKTQRDKFSIGAWHVKYKAESLQIAIEREKCDISNELREYNLKTA